MAQPRIGLLVVGFGGLDQAVKLSAGRRAFGCVAEQPVFSSDDHLPIILPISGKTWKSIIAGIRYMGAVSGFETVSVSADSSMAPYRCSRKRKANSCEAGHTTRCAHFTAAGQYLPALRDGFVGQTMA